MLDFLFIVSPTNALNPYPPFYFMYLAGYLERKGFRCKIIDPKGKGDQTFSIIGVIRENLARFIGFSAFHPDYDTIDAMARLAKNFQPQATILVGNAHATIDPHDFIYRGSDFDAAILGEGEETCLELAQGKCPEEIKGMVHLDRAKESVQRTLPRPFMSPADIAIPAYDKIDMDWYLRPTKLIIRRLYARVMPIFTGRGCPFDCSFCASNVVWRANTGRCARLRPVDSVMREIDLLKNYGVDFLYLSDDMFGVNKVWMRGWFDEYSRRHSGFPYACQSRANVITEETVRELKDSCCIQLDVGVESGDQKVLDIVNKGITLDQVRQVFEWCRKYGLRAFGSLMVGMPRESEVSISMTESLLRKIKPSGIAVSICTPYPGTKIYDQYVEPKLMKEEYGLLMSNNLKPKERFRMSWHSLDLDSLRKRLSRKFGAIPLFERMWPSDWNYWRAVLRSIRFSDYLKGWIVDILKTFLSYWRYKF